VYDSWHSYPKVYAIGHKAIEDIFSDEVIIQEKIDGSSFSFGSFDGVLRCRSKGQELVIEQPEKMFSLAVKTAKDLADAGLLHDGWTYRSEFLRIPKHNALAYDRVPKQHLILFDINTGNEKYLTYDEMVTEAWVLGLEVVPVLCKGMITHIDQIHKLLDFTSILGGQKVEGVVVKNYYKFTRDGKAMFGKFVSEEFKEVHGKAWKENNPAGKDIKETLGDMYRSEARWNKAIQHLKESGEYKQAPEDIGKLIHLVQEDVVEECEEEIKQKLWEWAKSHVLRHSTRGLPQWYKDKLLNLAISG